MPLRDKLVIAITVLLLLVGPFAIYKTIQVGMKEDIKLVDTISDSAATASDREAAEIKRRYLPPIVIGKIALFITAQIGMVILSALLIRQHKRRKRATPYLPR
jgi:prepilin signal peptidase PulO-like enzyme (type II secretory pathway)